jgi:hypothetical protein
MPILTPCVKTSGTGHFTVRSRRNNLGCDKAGRDQVKRRGRTTKRKTISCPLSSDPKDRRYPNRLSCSGASGRPIMNG